MDAHISALEALAREDADCYVSVKLPPLGFDPQAFAELVAAAAASRRRLHADAVAPDLADATWRLLAGSAGAAPLGTTLAGRWRRSPHDVDRAGELGLAVRVVKGQWPDVGGDREDPARGFLRIVDRLADHPGMVAVATHDVPLLEEALSRLLSAGRSCEVELFYGLPFRGPALAARRLSVPVRMYVPYGDTGTPYRRDVLASRPSAALWIAQDLLYGEEKTWRSIRQATAKS